MKLLLETKFIRADSNVAGRVTWDRSHQYCGWSKTVPFNVLNEYTDLTDTTMTFGWSTGGYVSSRQYIEFTEDIFIRMVVRTVDGRTTQGRFEGKLEITFNQGH